MLECFLYNNYRTLAWVTRRCPGWFKIGIKNSLETQDLIWYQKYVGIASPCGHALQLLFYKIPLKLSLTGPRSFQIWIWGPIRWPTPTKLGVPINFCFIEFLPKCTPEAPEPQQGPLLCPLDHRVAVGGVQPHEIAFRDIWCNFDFMNSPS